MCWYGRRPFTAGFDNLARFAHCTPHSGEPATTAQSLYYYHCATRPAPSRAGAGLADPAPSPQNGILNKNDVDLNPLRLQCDIYLRKKWRREMWARGRDPGQGCLVVRAPSGPRPRVTHTRHKLASYSRP